MQKKKMHSHEGAKRLTEESRFKNDAMANIEIRLVQSLLSGQYAEAAVELTSIGLGAKSAVDNFKDGKLGAMAVDIVGIVVDVVALAIPGVPGVAGLGIQASRGAAKAAEKAGNKAAAAAEKDASKAFSKDKQALVDMAKQDKKTGATPADMKAYQDLNKQLDDPFAANQVRVDPGHPSGGPHSQQPHGHVGKVGHIPIK